MTQTNTLSGGTAIAVALMLVTAPAAAQQSIRMATAR
jgi:hypothetical protein